MLNIYKEKGYLRSLTRTDISRKKTPRSAGRKTIYV